jgi:hypothetical protein
MDRCGVHWVDRERERRLWGCTIDSSVFSPVCVGVRTPHYVFMREWVLCARPLSKQNKSNRRDKTHRAGKSSPVTVFPVQERHNASRALLGVFKRGEKEMDGRTLHALWEYRGDRARNDKRSL